MQIKSELTEKVVKKTILITLETPEEVEVFKSMMRDIEPRHCINYDIANELRNKIRNEIER